MLPDVINGQAHCLYVEICLKNVLSSRKCSLKV